MIRRRQLLKSLGGTLALPLLDSSAHAQNTAASAATPTRFLVVGNPFGAHPDSFFPKDFGKDFTLSPTLQSLDWVKDRVTILGHTDHGMNSGHGKEIAFLSGVLPATAASFPEKNMTIDQIIARHTSSEVRFPSIEVGLGGGCQMNWTATGVQKNPFTDPQKLFDYLFLNLTAEERETRKALLARNGSILDAVGSRFSGIGRDASAADRDRLDQYATGIRDLETSLQSRTGWIDRDKPEFDISAHFQESEVTIANKYHAIFDMVAYAFQTDLTRVASVVFPSSLGYTDVKGVNRSYHGCTHNGKQEDVTGELVAIESFQIAQLSRCLRKLDEIDEPDGEGSLLDNTVVLFGSGMGYGGTHSNRNLPILVAGGGFKHLGHHDCATVSGESMPLCNLYVTLLQRFGIERDKFNISTGSFDFDYA